MRVSIFGTGHVGLVTAVCLADLGHTVVAVDKDADVVGRLAQGEPTLYEPGLGDLLRENLRAERLRFTTSAEDGVRSSEIIFLCVGTPTYPDGRADLSQVDEAVQNIVPHVGRYTLVVEKSTVPVDTANCIDRAIRLLAGRDAEVEVASNPEFLREGSAVRDFLHPDRIVIGADSERARALLLQLYQRGFDCPVLVTSVKMAELIKHAANAFLATKISFINMLADLCDKVGGDVSVLARGIGLDRRIGPHFLEAGLGFGGSCFRKDLHAFVRIADESGVDFSLLRHVDRINEARVDRLLAKLDRALWVVRDKRVAVLGLAFKPDTDDIREAPSLRVVPRLLERGAALSLYDPRAVAHFAALHPPGDRLGYAASGYEALRDAHAAVILTGWEEFQTLDWERARSLMRTPVVVDGRNLFPPEEMRARGFEYYSLGRGDAAVALGVR
jgi:UDPglucose 6-dehydrogenase